MDYIDFQIIENKIVCTPVYNGKKLSLSIEEAKLIFKILVKNNYNYRELLVNDVRTLRYYGVSQKLIEQIRKNRFRTKRKVNRKNKYTGITLALSGSLVLILTLNSLGLFSNNKETIFNNDKETFTIENDNKSSYNTAENDNKSSYDIEDVEIEEEVIVPDSTFYFEYEDRSNNDKAILARELYTDVITRNANIYGLPSNLMLAVGTQERGTHSTEISPDGGFGLFQIQVDGGWNWLGKTVTAYNFETQQMESIVVCQNEDGTIDVNMLADLEYNTKVACMIMSYDLSYCDYDLIAALQTYNSGTGVMSLKKEYGEDWVNHRENLPGDPEYIEHVLSYIPEGDSLLQYKDPSGRGYVIDVNNVYDNTLNKSR